MSEDADRPEFGGCVLCYGAAWVARGVSRLRDRLPGATADAAE